MFSKKSVFFDKISNIVYWIIRGIEILLAGLLIVLVVASSAFLLGKLLQGHYQLSDYSFLQQLLSYLLLLIIALELAYMLIEHKPNSVVEVMIYAIARKALIYNTTALDILISVVTLAILFIIKLYLIKDSPSFLKSIINRQIKRQKENN